MDADGSHGKLSPAKRDALVREQASWPDPPTFQEMSRLVQERLAGPAHDEAVQELRQYEQRWASTTKDGRVPFLGSGLVGAMDDPSFPRSGHLHEDLYGEGRTE